jgi:tripartite-type tricarboxylate transporter receptor subunit TctC
VLDDNLIAVKWIGLEGLAASSWFGAITPARTPKELVGRLNTEILRALRDAGPKGRFEYLGAHLAPNTPEAFEAFISGERAKWERIARGADITLQGEPRA